MLKKNIKECSLEKENQKLIFAQYIILWSPWDRSKLRWESILFTYSPWIASYPLVNKCQSAKCTLQESFKLCFNEWKKCCRIKLGTCSLYKLKLDQIKVLGLHSTAGFTLRLVVAVNEAGQTQPHIPTTKNTPLVIQPWIFPITLHREWQTVVRVKKWFVYGSSAGLHKIQTTKSWI